MITETELLAAGYEQVLYGNQCEYEKKCMGKTEPLFTMVVLQKRPSDPLFPVLHIGYYDKAAIPLCGFESLAEVEALFALLAKGVSVTLSELREGK